MLSVNYDVKNLGWNMYMNEFSASIGLVQLSKLDILNKKRKKTAKIYSKEINLEGPDHPFALIPEELEKMIHAIREADKAKGTGEKIVLKEEEELRQFATRSIQAIKNISKGEILKEGINIDILRPGNQKRGAEPRFLLEIVGKKAARDVGLGEGILQEDCSEE